MRNSSILLRKIGGVFTAVLGHAPPRPARAIPRRGRRAAAIAGALLMAMMMFVPLLAFATSALAGHRHVIAAHAIGGILLAVPPATGDVVELLNSVNDAFKVFKAKAFERIDALELRVRETETVAARRFDGNIASSTSRTAGRPEARAAFARFARSGDVSAMTEFLPKDALQTQVGPDGGFLVPEEINGEIDRLQRDLSPMRQLARVRPVKTDRPEQLINVNGVDSGWVGETQERDDTESDGFAKIAPPMGELYAQPKVTQRELDDSAYDIGEILSTSIGEEFAVQEGAGFINGNGILKPKGILTYPTATTKDSVRPLGTIQYVKTGDAAGFAAVSPADCLISMMQALRPVYRVGASWIMNSATVAVVRKLKDGFGDYLWRSGLELGRPNSLLGYPVNEDENMPDIAGGAFPIAFGNWTRGYLICDHFTGVRMLRDPLTAKPWVKFYTTKRVGGAVVNSQAIKLLKVSA